MLIALDDVAFNVENPPLHTKKRAATIITSSHTNGYVFFHF